MVILKNQVSYNVAALADSIQRSKIPERNEALSLCYVCLGSLLLQRACKLALGEIITEINNLSCKIVCSGKTPELLFGSFDL